MNIFDERIKAFQAQMRLDGLKAYIVPATDPHISEAYAKRFGVMRFYFCSFKGEDGTLLVTQDASYIYTDGRYWVEAEAELKGTSCQLVKSGKPGVPSMVQFIKDNDLYPLGLDASLFPLYELRKYYAGDSKKIVSLDYSFLVKDLPDYPSDKIFKVDQKYLSTTREERVKEIMKRTAAIGAKAVLLTALDDIAYVLGYRGNDIDCTPVFYSWLYIDEEENLHLFIDAKKLPDGFKEEKVIIHPYESLISFLDERKDVPTSIDPKKVNALICAHLNNRIYASSPAYQMKCVKGDVEVKNLRHIHEEDGLQVLKLMKYVDDHLDSGFLNEESCAEYVDSQRLALDDCYELSFGTIAAVDSNAAMMHYAPTKEKYSPVNKTNQLLLVDSGGQYFGGTSDITRTFILSDHPSKEVIHDYTLTLKSQIALITSVFEAGCTGHSIDITAREVMWKEGLDYKCGTGHGVGYMGCCHEGPIGFRFYDSPDRDDQGELKIGNVITIEPGVYKDYKYGIRLENELLVVPAYTTDQGIFYKFEVITYCPYDRRGIDVTMLTDEEIKWFNEYSEMVYTRLAPLASNDKDLLAYLRKQTLPLAR
jgi:Xaa-Pro aminopeptidase